MVFRLNLSDAKDREFLTKKGVDIKALLKDQEKAYVANQALAPEKRLDANYSEGKSAKTKYRNKKAEYNGLKFDSQFELSCWLVLESLEKQGHIFSLKRQVKVEFKHNNVKLMGSRPDFYFEVEANERRIPIYADAKNKITAKLRPFRIAQNMFRAFYGAPMIVFLTYTNIEKEIANHVANL